MTKKSNITPSNEIIANLVKNNFIDINIIETRNSDSLDFYDVAIWSIVNVIKEAYKQGYQHAVNDDKNKNKNI